MRPSFSSNALLPCTTRQRPSERITPVSDGKPFWRLLVLTLAGSKAGNGEGVCGLMLFHDGLQKMKTAGMAAGGLYSEARLLRILAVATKEIRGVFPIVADEMPRPSA